MTWMEPGPPGSEGLALSRLLSVRMYEQVGPCSPVRRPGWPGLHADDAVWCGAVVPHSSGLIFWGTVLDTL